MWRPNPIPPSEAEFDVGQWVGDTRMGVSGLRVGESQPGFLGSVDCVPEYTDPRRVNRPDRQAAFGRIALPSRASNSGPVARRLNKVPLTVTFTASFWSVAAGQCGCVCGGRRSTVGLEMYASARVADCDELFEGVRVKRLWAKHIHHLAIKGPAGVLTVNAYHADASAGP